MESESGKLLLTGIAIGGVIVFYLTGGGDHRSSEEEYLTRSSELTEAQSCISGYKEMVSHDAESVSLSLSSIASDLSFAEGEDYETISDALSEARDKISSMSSDYDYISKEPKECL